MSVCHTVSGRPPACIVATAAMFVVMLLVMAPPSSAAQSGRYRVSVTGFSVKSPTWDHALEVDGKGDEVYVAARVTQLDPDGSTVLAGDRLSETLGDTNGQNGRIQAGTAPCCWPTFMTTFGGLRAGDSFPTSTPWVLDPQPSLNRNYPPMTLWEGDLSAGGDAVVIAPSLWEWDGGKDAYGDWIRWAQATAKKLGARIGELLGPQAKPIVDATSLGLDTAVSMSDADLIGNASDRPIGMQKSDGKVVYDPKVFTLTRQTAELASKLNLSGLGDGVFGIRLTDDSSYRGDYVLYIKIEKLADTSTPDPVSPPGSNPPPGNNPPPGSSLPAPVISPIMPKASAANLARGIPVTVRCTTPCRGTVSMKLDAKTAKASGLSRLIAQRTVIVGARKTVTVLVTPSPRAVRALKKHKIKTVTVTADITDANRRTTSASQRITVR